MTSFIPTSEESPVKTSALWFLFFYSGWKPTAGRYFSLQVNISGINLLNHILGWLCIRSLSYGTFINGFPIIQHVLYHGCNKLYLLLEKLQRAALEDFSLRIKEGCFSSHNLPLLILCYYSSIFTFHCYACKKKVIIFIYRVNQQIFV